jgi:hypothetical protein
MRIWRQPLHVHRRRYRRRCAGFKGRLRDMTQQATVVGPVVLAILGSGRGRLHKESQHQQQKS